MLYVNNTQDVGTQTYIQCDTGTVYTHTLGAVLVMTMWGVCLKHIYIGSVRQIVQQLVVTAISHQDRCETCCLVSQAT